MRVQSQLFRVGIFSIVLPLANSQVGWAEAADHDQATRVEVTAKNGAESTGTDLRFAAARLVSQIQATSSNTPATAARGVAPAEAPRIRGKSSKWIIIIAAAAGAAVAIAVATHNKSNAPVIAAGPPTVGAPQ
jgi:hypothetical protein